MRLYRSEHLDGARVDDGWAYRGMRTVVIENELLRIVVLADKGGDVLSLVHKPSDTEFLWRRATGVRDPRAFAPTTGAASHLWLDTYEGGWQSVFPNGGGPSTVLGADLGVHGESALVPWDVRVVDEGPATAQIELRVRLTRTPFEATRTITLERGSSTLAVEETVVNIGTVPFPVSYGQHLAFGPPLLNQSCILDLPGAGVRVHPELLSDSQRFEPAAVSEWPFAIGRDGRPVDLRVFPGPDIASEDLIYFDDLADGWYALTNRERGIGVAVRYPHTLFRHLWHWQVLGGTGYPWYGRNYNIGLEPFTSATNKGLAESITDHSAVFVAAGEGLTGELRLHVFEATSGVERVDADGTVTLRPSHS